MTFYAFPKEHWKHLRTTNPVESPFAAVRLRTARRSDSRGGQRHRRDLEAADGRGGNFRRVNAPELIKEVDLGRHVRRWHQEGQAEEKTKAAA